MKLRVKIRELRRFLLAVQDGFGLFLIAIALFAVATNTQTGWLFLPSALILVGLASHLWASRGLANRQLLDSFRCDSGSLQPLRVHESGSIRVLSQFGGGAGVLAGLELHLVGEISGCCQLTGTVKSTGATCRVVANKRGRHSKLTAELQCYRPLGWVNIFRHLQVSCSPPVLVGPARFELDLPRWLSSLSRGELGQQAQAGAVQSRNTESGEFERLREYSSGDDTRLIHWLSSARSGTLVVRQSGVNDSNQQGAALFLDAQIEDPSPEAFENLISLAASLYEDWTALGPVRLFSNFSSIWSEVEPSEEFWASISPRLGGELRGLSDSMEISTLDGGSVSLGEVRRRLFLSTRSVGAALAQETVILVGPDMSLLHQQIPELFVGALPTP